MMLIENKEFKEHKNVQFYQTFIINIIFLVIFLLRRIKAEDNARDNQHEESSPSKILAVVKMKIVNVLLFKRIT